MPAAACRIRSRLGRRGTPLLIIGTGQMAWGIGFMAAPNTNPVGLELLTDHAPLHCWAVLWMLFGAITAGSAFLKIGRDRWGFIAALVPPGVWAVAYLSSAAVGVYPRGLYVFIWYMTQHIGMTIWAASVPEYEAAPAPSRKRIE